MLALRYHFRYHKAMDILSASEARKRFFQLPETLAEGQEIYVKTRDGKGDMVILSADEWRAISETLHLSTIPGMSESIETAMHTPLEDCMDEAAFHAALEE